MQNGLDGWHLCKTLSKHLAKQPWPAVSHHTLETTISLSLSVNVVESVNFLGCLLIKMPRTTVMFKLWPFSRSGIETNIVRPSVWKLLHDDFKILVIGSSCNAIMWNCVKKTAPSPHGTYRKSFRLSMKVPILFYVQMGKPSIGLVVSEVHQLILWPKYSNLPPTPHVLLLITVWVVKKDFG